MPYLSQVSADPPAEAIKCVIIYENSGAGKAARQFFERLDAEAGGNCASSCELWNFRVLGIRSIRNEAARAALAADVVVFAISDAVQFPRQVKEWIDLWLWLNERGRPAVVALSTRANARNKGGPILHLQAAARRNNLSFFLHMATAPSAHVVIEEQSWANFMRETSGVSALPG